MSLRTENHIDNGVLIGAILLCLNDNKLLKNEDLIIIQKNLIQLDARRGTQIFLNPALIKEETNFYTSHKIYRFDNKQKGWILLKRDIARAYCNHLLDNTFKTAVAKTTAQKALENEF